jgi:hypothetical protein
MPVRPTKAEIQRLVEAYARYRYLHDAPIAVQRKFHDRYKKALAVVLKKLEASYLSEENERGLHQAAADWWSSRASRGPGTDY